MDHIFFARRADGIGPIKIGLTSNPRKACYKLSSWLGAKVVLLASTPGSSTELTALLGAFAHLNEAPVMFDIPAPFHSPRRKWFRADPELLDTIDRMRLTGRVVLPSAPFKAIGAPPPVDASAARQRAHEVWLRYRAGASLQHIADDLLLSRQRVYQILKSNGYPSNPHERGMRIRTEREAAQLLA